jgi:hypothetical protein
VRSSVFRWKGKLEIYQNREWWEFLNSSFEIVIKIIKYTIQNRRSKFIADHCYLSVVSNTVTGIETRIKISAANGVCMFYIRYRINQSSVLKLEHFEVTR